MRNWTITHFLSSSLGMFLTLTSFTMRSNPKGATAMLHRAATLCLFALIASIAPAHAQDNNIFDDLYPYLEPSYVQPITRIGFGTPHALAFTPDNTTLIAATGAGITLYNADTLEEIRYIDTEAHQPRVIAVSPDGTLIASANADARLWDAATGTLLEVMAIDDNIVGVAFSADGSQVAFSKGFGSPRDRDGIFIFDTASGRLSARLGEGSIFQWMQFHPDGKRLIARQIYDCCGNITLFDLETGEGVSIFDEPDAYGLSPDGETLFVYRGTWQALDLTAPDNSIMRQGAISAGEIRFASPVRADGTFTAIDDAGTITLWDGATLASVSGETLDLPDHDFNSRIGWSPDGTRLAHITGDGLLSILNAASGELLHQRNFEIAEALPVDFYGEVLIYSLNDGQLAAWNMGSGAHYRWAGHGEARTNVILTVSEWGTFLTGGDDGAIRSWQPDAQPDLTAENYAGEVFYQFPDALVVDLALAGERSLLAVVCPTRGEPPYLARIDTMTRERLLYYADRGATEPTLDRVPLASCNDRILNGRETGALYTNGEVINEIEFWAVPGPSSGAIVPYNLARLIASGGGDKPLLFMAQGAVLEWESFGFSGLPRVVATHNLEITAAETLPPHSTVISAACGRQVSNGFGDRFCYGVDMAISDWALGYRTSIIGHTDTVRQIVAHPSQQLFVSSSDDGTVIVWGAFETPRPVIRLTP
jgi:WD40 repeat protein